MNGQQLRQVSAPLSRRFSRAVGLSLAAVLVLLALAAVLAPRQSAFAPVMVAPTAQTTAWPTAWPNGTGSVYDGTAYVTSPATRPTAWPQGTGSVYDGR